MRRRDSDVGIFRAFLVCPAFATEYRALPSLRCQVFTGRLRNRERGIVPLPYPEGAVGEFGAVNGTY